MRMIDSLEEKGLAKRTVNPEDRRENLLSITDKGAEVVTQYQAIEKRLSNDLLEGIPADEVATFFRVVDLITQRANRL